MFIYSGTSEEVGGRAGVRGFALARYVIRILGLDKKESCVFLPLDASTRLTTFQAANVFVNFLRQGGGFHARNSRPGAYIDLACLALPAGSFVDLSTNASLAHCVLPRVSGANIPSRSADV